MQIQQKEGIDTMNMSPSSRQEKWLRKRNHVKLRVCHKVDLRPLEKELYTKLLGLQVIFPSKMVLCISGVTYQYKTPVLQHIE